MRPIFVTALLMLVACSEPPPALQVGAVAFTQDDLLGLTDRSVETLGELAAFAQEVAAGRLEDLGRPLVRMRRLQRLEDLLLAERALDSLGVGDEVLEARYRTDPALELTVRHLLVFSRRIESDASRRRAAEKARAALERIRAGEPFPDVAAEVSEEPGASAREGLLTPGREGSWVPEFWNAARALDVGAVSDVVETQYGFHVLRLEDREEVPFEEARADVVLEVARSLGVPAASQNPLAAPEPTLLETPEPTPAHGRDEAQVVASWDGGELTLGDLLDHLAALPLPAYRAAVATAESLRPEVVEAARRVYVEDEATARGLEVEASDAAFDLRTWTIEAETWAATFGFEAGAGPERLREVALAALTETGQNTDLARRALHERRPLLERRFELPPAG